MHIAQQMPLPLTISCSCKSRLVLTFLVLPFWYLLTQVVPDIFQKSSKTVVCVYVHERTHIWWVLCSVGVEIAILDSEKCLDKGEIHVCWMW